MAGSRNPQGRAFEVALLLRSHGLRARTAQTLAQLGAVLREQTAQTGRDYAALVDDATGAQVGAILGGDAVQVNLRPHLELLEPGRRYAHLHTHPLSSSFSDFDLSILLGHPELRTIAVVGPDGGWYVLSKRAGQPTPSPQEGLQVWAAEFLSLFDSYDALVRAGTIDSEDATRRQAHGVLTRIAPGLRLRYDHLGHL
jgi:hypothetical protein